MTKKVAAAAAIEEYVTVDQAAALTGAARSTVYGWIRRGLIPETDVRRQARRVLPAGRRRRGDAQEIGIRRAALDPFVPREPAA
jgi:excisionase family DNA binding protein